MADFLSKTPSRALTRLSMQQQARQQLIGEATAMQPDYDAVTKAIMDKKLYAADFAPIANEVNGMVNNYMTKFQADPFYAFSREGRRTVKQLRQIIHDPSIKMMEDNAKLADEQYKQAQERELGGDFVVKGGKVAAIRGGKRVFVDVDELNMLNQDAGEGILTVDTDHLLTRNQFGVRGEVPTYNMTSIKDIDQKIHNAFAGLGSTEVSRLLRDTSPGVDTNVRGKQNVNQLNAVVSNLLNRELTESDKNTLMSKYLQSAANPTKAGFDSWLQERILQVAEGKASTVDERKEQQAISLKNAKAQAEMAGIGKEPLGPAHLVVRGDYGTRPIIRTEGGTATTVRANRLPPETFKFSTGEYRDEAGVVHTSRKLGDLTVLSNATDLGNVLLRTAMGDGKGNYINLPNVKDFAVVADDDTGAPALTWEYSYEDPQTGGKQIIPSTIVEQFHAKMRAGQPLPPNIIPYTTQMEPQEAIEMIQNADYKLERDRQVALADAQKQAEQQGFVRVLKKDAYIATKLLVPKERGAIFTDYEDTNRELLKPIIDRAEGAGYKSKDSSSLRDYYNTYGGRGAILDDTLFNDELYELDARIPVTSFQAMNAAYGGKVTGERDDNNVATSGFYPKFDLVPSTMLDPTSIPNQVGRRQYQTLDAFKNAGTNK